MSEPDDLKPLQQGQMQTFIENKDVVKALRWMGGMTKKSRCFICVALDGTIKKNPATFLQCDTCHGAVSPITDYSPVRPKPTPSQQRFLALDRKKQLEYLPNDLLDALLADEISFEDMVGVKKGPNGDEPFVRSLVQSKRAALKRIKDDEARGHRKYDPQALMVLARYRRAIQDDESSFTTTLSVELLNTYLSLIELNLLYADEAEARRVLETGLRRYGKQFLKDDRTSLLIQTLQLENLAMDVQSDSFVPTIGGVPLSDVNWLSSPKFRAWIKEFESCVGQDFHQRFKATDTHLELAKPWFESGRQPREFWQALKTHRELVISAGNQGRVPTSEEFAKSDLAKRKNSNVKVLLLLGLVMGTLWCCCGGGCSKLVPWMGLSMDSSRIVDPGRTVALKEELLYARSVEDFDRLQKFSFASDSDGIKRLENSGKAGVLDAGTLIKVLETDPWANRAEISVQSGRMSGKVLYVPLEPLQIEVFGPRNR